MVRISPIAVLASIAVSSLAAPANATSTGVAPRPSDASGSPGEGLKGSPGTKRVAEEEKETGPARKGTPSSTESSNTDDNDSKGSAKPEDRLRRLESYSGLLKTIQENVAEEIQRVKQGEGNGVEEGDPASEDQDLESPEKATEETKTKSGPGDIEDPEKPKPEETKTKTVSTTQSPSADEGEAEPVEKKTAKKNPDGAS
ncbi:hypothetical protein CDD83_2497 [Cordyceps sp. RAO-2017]|nr:hypothetical protein CDD83_2497 [Cordyceps sp. RAO-2017]